MRASASAIEFKDTLHFESIKEHRGTYLVQYDVPLDNYSFANVFLVFLEPTPPEPAAKAMETELELWARRYPVPVMVTSFTDTDDVLRLVPTRPESHLIGWVDPSGALHAHWHILKNEEMPSTPYSRDQLLAIYHDVPHRWNTADQKRHSIRTLALQNRALLTIVVFWLVVVPITIAVVGMANFWVGLAATVYSVLQGLWKLSGFLGLRKQSRRTLEKEAAALRMKHHDYWCRKNPAGFSRLMSDAIDAENRETLRKEAEELKRRQEGRDPLDHT